MDKTMFTGDEQGNEFKQSENKVEKKFSAPRPPSGVQVMHNKNWTKEFQVGRKWFRFEPYEVKTMTTDEINHPDFQAQKQYFSVKES
jgi:hypothetical protein